MSGNLQTIGNPGMRLILPLPGNETFARRLAEAGGWELGAIEHRRFPEGETFVRILSDVANKAIDLVCTRPDEGLPASRGAANTTRALAGNIERIGPHGAIGDEPPLWLQHPSGAPGPLL